MRMRVWMWVVSLLAVVLAVSRSEGQAGGAGANITAAPGSLRCEGRENPLGIPARKPGLSWKIAAKDPAVRGLRQTAYQIVAASTVEALAGDADLWDSGKVVSAEMVNVEYAGKELGSRARVWWKVRVWDGDDRVSEYSEGASFSVGLLEATDWSAEWIGMDEREPTAPLTAARRQELRGLGWVRLGGPPERTERVGYFRFALELPGTPEVKAAHFSACADMIGKVWINGREATQVNRWDPASTVDVGPMLTAGKNTLCARVENHDGLNPAISGAVFVEFADGTAKTIPLRAADSRASAHEVEGWTEAGFADGAWAAAEESKGQAWGANRNTEHFLSPAPYVRKEFVAGGGKAIRAATLYATGLGLYEARLNGRRVTSDELTPGWTEYANRVYHNTYDVTSLVKDGENCLGAVVGDGWYAGLMGYTGRRRFYAAPPRVMMQLDVEYEDGTRDVIATDENWTVSTGPILYSDLYLGSHYDARLEMKGWDTAGFDDGAWKGVAVGLAAAPRSVDVTKVLADQVKENRLRIEVGPRTLPDPAYGVVKTLTVEYTAGGKAGRISKREGEVLDLPGAGESGEFRVVKAEFAEPGRSVPRVLPNPGEAVRRYERIRAKSVTAPRAGRYVFDLGQNMVGIARVRVRGEAGQKVTVRYAEFLNPDGTLYTSNLRGATATDYFTLAGGVQTLEPPFTFHGFRYVELTGLTEKPDTTAVTGIVMHSAMTPTAEFESSNVLLNRLFANTVWGQKGNYLEVPTDCPQRDERLGWTGDAQFFARAASYNFDIDSFLRRWILTLAQDAQYPDGTFAHVAPKVDLTGGSTAWGDAAIVCTHALWEVYADRSVIRENFDAMRRYMAWLETKTSDGRAKVGGFGDWVNLGDPTSQDLIDTAYRAYLLKLMSEMSAAIGESGEAMRFGEAHGRAVADFRRHFLNEDGSLKDSGQTGYALAFTMGLIPEAAREKAAGHFLETLKRKDFHLATGFIGTPRLLPGLHMAGRDDAAYRLMLNETYPSWLFQVKLGATTMWERWDGFTPEKGFQDVGMNSFNHYAFGSVGHYMFEHVAGISALEPGYRTALIRPVMREGLEHVTATYDSVSGKFGTAWARSGERATLRVTVPANTRAVVVLPTPDAATVIESSRKLGEAAGLRVLGSAAEIGAALNGGPLVMAERLAAIDPGAVVVMVGSGDYSFEFPVGAAPAAK